MRRVAKREWRVIPEVDGKYEVRRDGLIRRTRSKRLMKRRSGGVGIHQRDGGTWYVSTAKAVFTAFFRQVPEGKIVVYVNEGCGRQFAFRDKAEPPNLEQHRCLIPPSFKTHA